jgi:hypothetical protein
VVSFIQGLFQFSPTADFALSGTVHVEMTESHAQRMEVDQIKKFLGAHEAQPFVEAVLEAFADGEKAYLIYEVHRAKRLKITSADNSDIAPGIKAGTIGHIPSRAKPACLTKAIRT